MLVQWRNCNAFHRFVVEGRLYHSFQKWFSRTTNDQCVRRALNLAMFFNFLIQKWFRADLSDQSSLILRGL